MPTGVSLAIWILMVYPTSGTNSVPAFAYFTSQEKCQHAVAIVKKETSGVKALCLSQ